MWIWVLGIFSASISDEKVGQIMVQINNTHGLQLPASLAYLKTFFLNRFKFGAGTLLRKK